MIQLPIYNQVDKAWKSLALGTTGNTIGSHGCLVTSIVMGLANYSIKETPATAVAKLAKAGGFQPSGDLNWLAVEKAWPNVAFHSRSYTTNESRGYFREEVGNVLDKIGRLLNFGQPVYLNVDAIGGDKVADHWVVAHKKAGDDLFIHDPNGGKAINFKDKYGDPKKGIYGYAIILGAPINYPDGFQFTSIGTALWMSSMVARGKNVATYAKQIQDAIIG